MTIDLSLSDEQRLLRESVRSMCERHSSIEIVRSLEGDRQGFSDDLWRSLREMGLLHLLTDDWQPVETALVCEELGRALAPSPYIETAVLAAALGVKPDGISVLAWHEAERTDTEEGVAVRFADGKVVGEKILVPFASSADRLLVLSRDDSGIVVVSVDPATTKLSVEGTLASDARYKVTFDESPGEVVARGWTAFMAAMIPSLVAVGAYAVGAAKRAHEISVEYANERVQFDRVIGSFQAMAHPLADLATEIGAADALVYQAAWALAERKDSETVAAMAKYYACDVFRKTAKFGHQVFGGIGFTLDIDIQLFMRRAKQLEVLWFGPRTLEEMLAGAELDSDEPFVTPDAVASAAK